MKKILALIFVLSVFTTTFGQNKNSISLIREKMELPDRKFYIDSIVDNRIDKSNIGIVRKGLFSSKQLLQLQGGLTSSLKEYYDYLLPKGVDQVPILLKINKLEVSEKAGPGVVYGFVDVYIEYYQGDRLLCGSKQHIEVSDIEVTRLHEENIREALKKSLLEFANSAWNSRDEQNKQVSKPNVMPTVSEASVGEPQKESNAVQASPAESPKRNTFTVGYQIGGYSLIGFDYEIRMHNYVGAHIGAGLAGYTYGIMIHTNPKRTSPFFNISYKDGGFGMLSVAGVEYGWKWVFNKQTGFGMLFQLGMVKLLKVDGDIAQTLFKGAKIPEYMTSIGIGLSW